MVILKEKENKFIFDSYETNYSRREERRITGRFVAAVTAIFLCLLGLYQALIRGTPEYAAFFLPAVIMFIYILWILHASKAPNQIFDASLVEEQPPSTIVTGTTTSLQKPPLPQSSSTSSSSSTTSYKNLNEMKINLINIKKENRLGDDSNEDNDDDDDDDDDNYDERERKIMSYTFYRTYSVA